jgi:hypothetical protein
MQKDRLNVGDLLTLLTVENEKKNPLDRIGIPPLQKPSDELRSMLRGVGRGPTPVSGVRRELDSRLTRYDEGSQQIIDEIQQMLDLDPNNQSLLDWLAFMMYTNERFIDSLDLYRRLLELKQDNPTAHYYSANCYFRMGETDKAILEWRQAQVLSPASKIGRKAAARIDMAKGKLGGR